MATLKDISRRSGYSVTTVSRALNGYDDVSEQTRGLIAAAAREMDYRPNQVARKLVSGRSGMIGLVLGGPPEPFTHGHFFEVITGLSRAFSARDMDFVLHIGSGGSVLTDYSRLINRGTLDGFVVTAPEVGDPRPSLLRERGVPFVMHGRDPAGDDGYPFFDVDNYGISRTAVALLARLGHRRIALLNGPESAAYAQERLRGYRDGMRDCGARLGPALVRHGDSSEAYAAAAAEELLDRHPAPTAFVCCNSLAAAGVLRAAGARGLLVPRDLSIVAHDDDLPQVRTAGLDPPLTVTWSPLRDSAEPLVDLLLRRLGGAPAEELQVTREAVLIERASAAAPRPEAVSPSAPGA